MSRSLWPKTKFVDSNTVSEQLAHILSEIDEAAEAGEVLSDDHFHHTDPTSAIPSLPLFRELGDIQASIETLWGILDRVYGEGFSEKMIRSWIEEKNRVRGYYPDLCREEYSPCFQCGHCGAFPKADPAAVAVDMLSMAGIEIDIESASGWSRKQVEQVTAWAGAIILHASDHEDVEVPERPEFLVAYLGRKEA